MKIKSTVIIYLLLVMLLPITVYATGGGLRKNSLKTCPNGITYGMHSDGHGGTHWHVAVTNGNNYFADGDAIYSIHVQDMIKTKELLDLQMVIINRLIIL